MHFTDQAIILDAQRFQESKYILSLFTQNHGLVKGLFAANKKNKPDMLSGNVVNMAWNARLPDHLGTVRLETITNVFTIISDDRKKMNLLNSALAMVKAFLHEKEPQLDLYEKLIGLMESIKFGQDQYKDYVLFELALLKKSGYGLDLSKCVSTGQKSELDYISPRSGGAVSKQAGEPYKDKMFALPKFFLNHSVKASVEDIKIAANILSHFLAKFYFDPYDKKMPGARKQVLDDI